MRAMRTALLRGALPAALLLLAAADASRARDLPPDLEAELARRGLTAAEAVQAADSLASADSLGDPAGRIVREASPSRGSSASAAPATAAAPPRRPPASGLPRFGASLFALPTDAFSPPVYGPIAAEYRLGPGDEIVVDVWGDTVFRRSETVNREGVVLLPEVGQVPLSGLSLAAAERRLRDRLSKVLSGVTSDPPTTFLDVSLGRLRPVQVFVVGDAVRPGAYDLSAASTSLHALYFAGGPTPDGSLRDVRVVRDGKTIASLDVYAYLRDGQRSGDVRLENDDTVFVPLAGPRVSVSGDVRRPGLYELADGETLADVLAFAGGPTATTATGHARVERVLPPAERRPGEPVRIVLDVPLREVLDGGIAFPLQDEDGIVLDGVPEDRTGWVSVTGQVWQPGTFQWREGLRVSDLLAAAGGLRPDAYAERAALVRTRDDGTRDALSLNLAAAAAGDASADVLLQARDEVTVFALETFRVPRSVSIRGSVREPGDYELPEGMSLGELLLRAGGFTEDADPESVLVSRVRPKDGDEARLADTFPVAVGPAFLASPGDVAFLLENHDLVFVRRVPHWELHRVVQVAGEVRFPGTYSLQSPTETLVDVLGRAGGLLDTAYPAAFRLERKEGVGQVSVDLDRALRKPKSPDNLILRDGDRLTVPERPMTVSVAGAVGFPTSLVFQPGQGIGDYIDDSGGYTDQAKKGETTVIYATGRAAKVKRWWPDPDVEPGARIVVPAKSPDAGIDWGSTIRSVTAIVASLATTVLVVDRLAD